MYCVYDTDNRVIAFHDDKHVVETYVYRVKTSHEEFDDLPDLRIGKIKKKKAR